MREKTITEVLREPIVSYMVYAILAGDDVAEPYDDESGARDAAQMLVHGGATEVRLERRILRVVEDVEELPLTP